MTTLIAFNKPYGVLCQFTDNEGRANLSHFIQREGVYAAGRLDRDSEGLLLLTDNGRLQHAIAHPAVATEKSYLAQVDGAVTEKQLSQLTRGLMLKDGKARALSAKLLARKPGWLWKREPPIRQRQKQPTFWLELVMTEGRNRIVRRLTAAAGLPTLRLIRTRIGSVELNGLKPGEYREVPASEGYER